MAPSFFKYVGNAKRWGGAGVLFEGLGEGGLLRVVEPLCHLRYRKRAICQSSCARSMRRLRM